MKGYLSAQADFRANDRDGDRIQQFWTADIAGLHAIPGRDGSPIHLVGPALAAADARPLPAHAQPGGPVPLGGYLFVAIRPAGKPGPACFAACAYPARYGPKRRRTFIVDENAVIYMKDLGRSGGIDVFPADPEAEGWDRIE